MWRPERKPTTVCGLLGGQGGKVGDEVVESEKDGEGQRNNGCGRSPKNEADLRGNGKGRGGEREKGNFTPLLLLLLRVVPWDGSELSLTRLEGARTIEC